MFKKFGITIIIWLLSSVSGLSMTSEANILGSGIVTHKGDYFTINLIARASCFDSKEKVGDAVRSLVGKIKNEIDESGWYEQMQLEIITSGSKVQLNNSYKKDDPCDKTWKAHQDLLLTFHTGDRDILSSVVNRLEEIIAGNDEQSFPNDKTKYYIERQEPKLQIYDETRKDLRRRALELAREDAIDKFTQLLGSCIVNDSYQITKVNYTNASGSRNRSGGNPAAFSAGPSEEFIELDDITFTCEATFTFSYEPIVMTF